MWQRTGRVGWSMRFFTDCPCASLIRSLQGDTRHARRSRCPVSLRQPRILRADRPLRAGRQRLSAMCPAPPPRRLDDRPHRRLVPGRSSRRSHSAAGLEDPRFGDAGQRGADPDDRDPPLDAREHLLQVLGGFEHAGAAERQALGARRGGEVHHHLSAQRGGMRQTSRVALPRPGRLPRAVHSLRPPLPRQRRRLLPLRRSAEDGPPGRDGTEDSDHARRRRTDRRRPAQSLFPTSPDRARSVLQ